MTTKTYCTRVARAEKENQMSLFQSCRSVAELYKVEGKKDLTRQAMELAVCLDLKESIKKMHLVGVCNVSAERVRVGGSSPIFVRWVADRDKADVTTAGEGVEFFPFGADKAVTLHSETSKKETAESAEGFPRYSRIGLHGLICKETATKTKDESGREFYRVNKFYATTRTTFGAAFVIDCVGAYLAREYSKPDGLTEVAAHGLALEELKQASKRMEKETQRMNDAKAKAAERAAKAAEEEGAILTAIFGEEETDTATTKTKGKGEK